MMRIVVTDKLDGYVQRFGQLRSRHCGDIGVGADRAEPSAFRFFRALPTATVGVIETTGVWTSPDADPGDRH
jgi:hypothetical protein